jgi:hypothetical protein
MQKKCCRLAKLGRALVIVGIIYQGEPARAGWTGLINGAGFGWASVNIKSSTQNTSKATTPSLTGPSASISPASGYTYSANSPAGASVNTYSRIKGAAGGIWQAKTFAAVGDGTDNPELENRVTVTPADCASVTMDTSINQQEFNANGHSATISVNATATAGTALWLRGFEYTGDPNLLPQDDPNTPQNETIEYLKVHGVWKFETLIVGPFDFGGASSGNCPLLIPFTLESSNLDNLIFAADAVAKTTQYSVTCPSDVTVGCGEPVHFPPVQVSGGCGTSTGTWSPPETYAFPLGITPVTVTASDEGGNKTSCNFNVIVTDNVKPIKPTLADITVGECSGTPPIPQTTDNCAGTVFGKTTTVFPITAQGTTVVTWCFDDGNGNVTTANQNVIVHDVTPPVKPSLPDLTFSTCSGVPAIPPIPSTTDNCKGIVKGTTTTPFPITTAGTTVVTWSFNDGNGNVTTAKQNVILTGLTFTGFYSPINGTDGTCSAPVRNINQGSVVPIKFDIFCGNSPITSGTSPVIKIQKWLNCAFVSEPVSVNAVYQNDWHYNWDTSSWANGIYKVIVVLPDGTSRFAFIKLK